MRMRFSLVVVFSLFLPMTAVAASGPTSSAARPLLAVRGPNPSAARPSLAVTYSRLIQPTFAQLMVPTFSPLQRPESIVIQRADTTLGSPVDTLHMSPLEHVLWGSKGLFRKTGLFPLHPDSPADDLRQISQVRRKMLSWHQALGLATVASMTVTVVGGQRAINGNGSKLHTASLPFTIGLYATSATLALASPPKLIPPRGGIDSITFHKAFAVLHLAGMIITPMFAEEAEDGGEPRAHQILGYATYGAFTAGMITVTFFR